MSMEEDTKRLLENDDDDQPGHDEGTAVQYTDKDQPTIQNKTAPSAYPYSYQQAPHGADPYSYQQASHGADPYSYQQAPHGAGPPPQYQTIPVTQTVTRYESQVIPDSYMGWSVFNCLCCMWPLGLVAICKSSEVKTHLDAQNMEAARQASSTARTLNIVATIWGIIDLIVVLIVYFTVFYGQDDPYGP